MQRQNVIYASLAVLALVIIVAVLQQTPQNTTSRSAGGSVGMYAGDMGKVMMDEDGYAYVMAMPESASFSSFDANATLGTTAADVDQKVIKTGDLELQVDSANDTAKSLTDLATANDGFVESSSISEDDAGIRRGWMTLRVPSDKFETVIASAKELAEKVVRESTNGQDVTEQFTDLEARLRSAQAQEEQYLVILETAVTVDDVLAVQERLGQIRAQIESLQGQITYYENRTSYSSIAFTLVEETHVAIPTGKLDLGDEIRDAARMLIGIAQQLLVAIIWIIVIGGPIAILGYISYRGYRHFKR